MRYLTTLLLSLVMMISGCAPMADEPVSSEPLNPEEPASNVPTAEPQPDSFSPVPADDALIRSEVYIDSLDLLTLESYPLQFMLNISGSLPTPCHQLRIHANPPDAQNRINIEAYAVSDPGAICVQVLAPFEVNYPLGSFPAGSYSLWVNSVKVADFQS